jgi:hypothetical protein
MGQKASHFEKLRFQMVETVKTSGPVLLRSHVSWTVATQARAPPRASRYTVAGTKWLAPFPGDKRPVLASLVGALALR